MLVACGTASSESPAAAGGSAPDRVVAEPSESPESPASTASTGTSPKGAQEKALSVPKILDFSAETVAGDAFKGASLAGKPAVLWFWAPWCPTCRGQIDGVSALVDEYGDKVAFVGVGSLDQAPRSRGLPATFPPTFRTCSTLMAMCGGTSESWSRARTSSSMPMARWWRGIPRRRRAGGSGVRPGRLTCLTGCSRWPWAPACSRPSTRAVSRCSRRISPC